MLDNPGRRGHDMSNQGNRMTHRRLVTDYAIIERRPGYDAANIPLRLTVAQLTPVGVTWRADGVQHVIRNESGVIAVVEAPFDSSANCAYLVDAHDSLRRNVPAGSVVERLMFYDVVESMNGAVAFLAAACGKDVWLEVRIADGAVTPVVNIRQ
ncbi:hypothetical protein [Burkholderia stagnalis]|uniref:hypothetical protein n=1 Tax=Burkholderia stagnalis TaxID=1503054 RepID=UPI0012D8E77F|nr:hypothetical protein [Burkholderia stagnalis]